MTEISPPFGRADGVIPDALSILRCLELEKELLAAIVKPGRPAREYARSMSILTMRCGSRCPPILAPTLRRPLLAASVSTAM
jgi:hypothetical protein